MATAIFFFQVVEGDISQKCGTHSTFAPQRGTAKISRKPAIGMARSAK